MRSSRCIRRTLDKAAAQGTHPEYPDKDTTPLNDSPVYRHRRGLGRQPYHPASHTLDLGSFDHDDDLDINVHPSQLRSGRIRSFFRNLFSKSDAIHVQVQSKSHGSTPSRYSASATSVAQSGRLTRHAAASSLGSLQSYATTTIKAGPRPASTCISQGSTSDVVMKRRVQPQHHLDQQPVFSQESRNHTFVRNHPNTLVYPTFALAEYGCSDIWASDVFVLPHNAIRWEIMDLYTILSSLQRRWSFLTMIDIWDLSEYWEVFEVFVAQYFEIEDQIVFPYLLNVASESDDLKRYHKVVKFNRDRMESMLFNIGLSLEQFNTSALASDVLTKVYFEMVTFLPKVLEYMVQQEHVLSNIFSCYCDPQDRLMINRACANFIVRAVNGREGIAILTRWIEDPMVLQVWKNENLSARAQHSYRKWVSTLEASHVDIVKRFQMRMRSIHRSEVSPVDTKHAFVPSGMADRLEKGSPGQSRGLGGSGRRFG